MDRFPDPLWHRRLLYYSGSSRHFAYRYIDCLTLWMRFWMWLLRIPKVVKQIWLLIDDIASEWEVRFLVRNMTVAGHWDFLVWMKSTFVEHRVLRQSWVTYMSYLQNSFNEIVICSPNVEYGKIELGSKFKKSRKCTEDFCGSRWKRGDVMWETW